MIQKKPNSASFSSRAVVPGILEQHFWFFMKIFLKKIIDNSELKNKDKVKGAVIDGVEPTFDAIPSRDYKVSRSLYFYVKKDHVGVIPGVQEYMEFFMSDDAVGEDGYLLDKGLIPLPASTRTKFQSDAKKLANLVR